TWSLLREGYGISMATTASDKLRDLARKILNEKRVPEPMIRAYIKEQEQKARMKKLFEELQTINSPLDILKKITQISPNRAEGGLFIKSVTIENEMLQVVGETTKIEILTRLENALKGIAKDGKVAKNLQGTPSKAGYRNFNYSLRINRKASQ
ncbi:MAG: hypothetical protein AABZ31_03340, partial [Bdellovibrionota bacterium]